MRRLTLLLAVVLFAFPTFAKFAVRPGWVKAYVNSTSRTQIESLVAATSSELLWIGSTQSLVYTPRLQTLQGKAIEMGMAAAQAKDIADTFLINGVRVDPANDLPAADDIREYPTEVGLYVLQFAANWDEGMATQLAPLGITVVSKLSNAAIVQGKHNDVKKAEALAWVAYRDYLHPRFRGRVREADRDRYYRVQFVVAPTAPDLNRIVQQLSLPSVAGSNTSLNFLGADIAPLFSHPFVQSVALSGSTIDIFGTLPAHGPADSAVILNVSYSGDVSSVRFNGVPAAFTALDHDRIRAIVPSIPNGPAAITVVRKDGWTQVLPSRGDYGFRVTETLGESTFARGDLAVVTMDDIIFVGSAPLQLEWFSPRGELRKTYLTQAITGPLFFGAQGFLNGMTDDAPFRFDATLARVNDGAALLTNAHSVTLARDGSSFVLVDAELRRHAPNGDLKEKGSLPLTRSIDLAVDQCTLVAAGADALKLFDGCRMQPLGVIRLGSWSAARFLPDGTILARNDDGTLARVTTGGALLYSAKAGSGNSLAIAPDGTFVWLGHDYAFSRFDLATNQLTRVFELSGRGPSVMTVYGEWTAARGEAAYDDDILVDEVQGFDFPAGSPVVIIGRGWLPGAQVTIGGVAVLNATVGTTRISFAMPNGAKSSREIVIRNPNGQRGLFTVPQKAKAKRRAA